MRKGQNKMASNKKNPNLSLDYVHISQIGNRHKCKIGAQGEVQCTNSSSVASHLRAASQRGQESCSGSLKNLEKQHSTPNIPPICRNLLRGIQRNFTSQLLQVYPHTPLPAAVAANQVASSAPTFPTVDSRKNHVLQVASAFGIKFVWTIHQLV